MPEPVSSKRKGQVDRRQRASNAAQSIVWGILLATSRLAAAAAVALIAVELTGDLRLGPGVLRNIVALGLGGAVGVLVYWAASPLRRLGMLGYYAAWVLAVEAALFTLLMAAVQILPEAPPGQPDLDAMLKDPVGIGFWALSALVTGVFFAREARRLRTDPRRRSWG
jgi:hypothetical protein